MKREDSLTVRTVELAVDVASTEIGIEGSPGMIAGTSGSTMISGAVVEAISST